MSLHSPSLDLHELHLFFTAYTPASPRLHRMLQHAASSYPCYFADAWLLSPALTPFASSTSSHHCSVSRTGRPSTSEATPKTSQARAVSASSRDRDASRSGAEKRAVAMTSGSGRASAGRRSSFGGKANLTPAQLRVRQALCCEEVAGAADEAGTLLRGGSWCC